MSKPSTAILDANKQIKSLITDDSVSTGVKNALTGISEDLEGILSKLISTEEFIVFKEQKRTYKNLGESVKGLGLGVVPLSDHIDDIIDRSDVLSPLYKKGFDFHNLYSFSDEEKEFSRIIGENFDVVGPALQAMRSAKADDRREGFMISFPYRNDPCFRKMLQVNKKLNFVKIAKLLFNSKGGRKFPFKSDTKGDVVNEEPGIFSFQFTSKMASSLIRGDWLTCFTHNIIEDQLTRLKIPHELYAKVSYKAPPEIVRHGSDFDVIGKYEDSLLMFECKSGILNSRVADDIKEKSNAFSTAVEETGGEKLRLENYLIFDPHGNDEDEVRNLFCDSDIEAIKPSEVRPLIIDITKV